MRSVVLAGLGLVAWAGVAFSIPPSPKDLHETMLARYQELRSFFAKVEVTFAFAGMSITTLPTKVWYSDPYIRIEREVRDTAADITPLEIHDTEQRKSWYLRGPQAWVEQENPGFSGPASLLALGLEYLIDFVPETVFTEEMDGEIVLVVQGRAGKARVTIWLEPGTLFIRRAVRTVGNIVWTVTVKEFLPQAEIAKELFQPPSAREILYLFRLSPEGLEIAQKVVERYRGLKSFILRKRAVEEHMAIFEEWVYWQPPLLRTERRTIPSPWLGSEVVLVDILNLAEGVVYTYYPREKRWEKNEVFFLQELDEELMSEFMLTVVFEGFGRDIVDVTEEILGQKRVWKLTSRDSFEEDAPLPQWWVDQETLQIVQYTNIIYTITYQRGDATPQWIVQTVRVVHFEENAEIPAELFAIPKDVSPARREPLKPLEPPVVVPEEKLRPAGLTLEWIPFSWEKLDEALRTAGKAVIYFGAEWCEPCKLLEEGPLSAPAVVELLSPLPRFKVDLSDFRDPRGLEVQKLYKVRALPTILFVGSDGKEIGRVTGYHSAPHLYGEIKRILAGVKP